MPHVSTPAPSSRRARPVAVGRRGFLRGAGLAGLAARRSGLLSACGIAGRQADRRLAASSKDLSPSQKTLDFSNWPLYIDEKKVKRGGKKVTVYPTLEGFQKDSGIKVDYVTDVNDNSEFFGVVRNQLGRLPAHRPRHHDADRLDGRTDGRTSAGCRSSTSRRCPTSTPTWSRTSRRPAGTRTATTRCPGRAA